MRTAPPCPAAPGGGGRAPGAGGRQLAGVKPGRRRPARAPSAAGSQLSLFEKGSGARREGGGRGHSPFARPLANRLPGAGSAGNPPCDWAVQGRAPGGLGRVATCRVRGLVQPQDAPRPFPPSSRPRGFVPTVTRWALGSFSLSYLETLRPCLGSCAPRLRSQHLTRAFTAFPAEVHSAAREPRL